MSYWEVSTYAHISITSVFQYVVPGLHKCAHSAPLSIVSYVFYKAVWAALGSSIDIVVLIFNLFPGAGKRARCSSSMTLLNMRCGKKQTATGSSSLWTCGTQSSARHKDRRSPLYSGQKVTLRLSLPDTVFSQSQTVSLTIFLESSEPESITIHVRNHLRNPEGNWSYGAHLCEKKIPFTPMSVVLIWM